MEWLRWYHGGVSDDKWPLIARKSGQSVAVVVAVWVSLLECASQAEERGSLSDFDPESADASLGLEDGTCQAVIDALSAGKRPRIIGGKIANWSKRQPLRERDGDDKSTGRVREYRERQKALQEKEKDACNADETPVKRHETPRSEQRREEKKEDPIPQSSTSTEGYAQAQAGAAGGIEHPVAHPEVVPGDSDDASGVTDDVPGIEFVELRELYDRMGRPEGPLSGFIEYKAAHKARDWPGIPRLTQAITELSEAGAWNPGMAPGLGRFLRERWWNRDPDTLPARASPAGSGRPTANTQHQQDRQNMEDIAALGLELRRRREQNGNTGNHSGKALGSGHALQAGHGQGGTAPAGAELDRPSGRTVG